MKIIDIERKGNVVRFYLGEKTDDWGWTKPDYTDYTGKTPDWLKPSDTYYGDDWDDAPYQHNAGEVYDEFVKGHVDTAFPFDALVLEPGDDEWGTNYHSICKNDLVDRKYPALIVVTPEKVTSQWDGYWECIGRDDVIKYYFGDDLINE